jgi:hypothetical protein
LHSLLQMKFPLLALQSLDWIEAIHDHHGKHVIHATLIHCYFLQSSSQSCHNWHPIKESTKQ